MSEKFRVPPRPDYRNEAPSQARLMERHQTLGTRHQTALTRVGDLARTQETVGQELSSELETLQVRGEAVEELQAPSSQGFLDGIVRRFTRRRTMLERRSAAESLVKQYEAVSVRLRRASAFTDELRLAALQLQSEVQELHQQIDDARHDGALAARRLLELERRLVTLEGETAELRERQDDTLRFELRQEAQAMELYQAAERMCRQHLEPAKALRDTVQHLYEEMSSFVLAASGTVDAAGRRIQALGTAADAPVVVTELRESLDELKHAMRATEAYLSQTEKLIAHTLPELSARIEAEAHNDSFLLVDDVQRISREQARADAERALREQAIREVEQALEDER